MTRPRAVLYGPAGEEEDRWLRTGTDWAAAMGYDLVTLVVDPDGTRWPTVFGLLVAGHVDIVVVTRHDHIPATLPRIDVIEEARHRIGPTPTVPAQRQQQRPRMLR